LADTLSEFATNFTNWHEFFSFYSCKFVQFVAKKTNCVTPDQKGHEGHFEENNPLCPFVSFVVFVISETALTVSPICG